MKVLYGLFKQIHNPALPSFTSIRTQYSTILPGSLCRCVLSVKNNGSLSRELQAIFPRNLIHDPQHTLDGMLALTCFFCNAFKTAIEYDMNVHLKDKHRMELITQLPLREKGFDMDYRIRFVS
jgi:hypothetical protein